MAGGGKRLGGRAAVELEHGVCTGTHLENKISLIGAQEYTRVTQIRSEATYHEDEQKTVWQRAEIKPECLSWH